MRDSTELKFVFKPFLSGVLSSCLLLSAVAGVLVCAPPCMAVSDGDRKEDLPVPIKRKPKNGSVYGDRHLKAVEAQILALAKENNLEWSEKKEDRITQDLKKLFAKETEPHALATLSIWSWMNREDNPLVRKLYHYDKIMENAFYQSMFRIADISGDDSAPALHRIMHQVNMNKDAMDKIRECLNTVTPDGFTSESRVIVHFSDERLNELPAPEDVAQFVVPLRESLWRVWKSPTLIASEIHANAKFTVDESLTISNVSVDTVVRSSPKSVWSMKSEYKKNAHKGLMRLKITQPLPMFTKQTDVIVEFYGP
jgi:hypothetical protein